MGQRQEAWLSCPVRKFPNWTVPGICLFLAVCQLTGHTHRVQRLLLLCALVASVTLSDCYCVTATNEGRKQFHSILRREGDRHSLSFIGWRRLPQHGWVKKKKGLQEFRNRKFMSHKFSDPSLL